MADIGSTGLPATRLDEAAGETRLQVSLVAVGLPRELTHYEGRCVT
nr:hypothetical protein [Herbidospora sakaeratensis]